MIPEPYRLRDGATYQKGINMLTQKRLKELLHYNPDTGVFTWRSSNSNRVMSGSEAGCKLKNRKPYILIRIDGKIYASHRLAFLYMLGDQPKDHVDHIDGNGLNNKWSNLRDVTNQENHKNMKLVKSNTSGICGVSWVKDRLLWHAYIHNSGKRLNLIYTNDFFEACCARKSAERKYGFHRNHGSQR